MSARRRSRLLALLTIVGLVSLAACGSQAASSQSSPPASPSPAASPTTSPTPAPSVATSSSALPTVGASIDFQGYSWPSDMNVLVTLVSTWYGAQLDVYGVQLEIDDRGQAGYRTTSDSGLTAPVALWDTDGNQHQPEGYSVPPGLKVLWHVHVLPETSSGDGSSSATQTKTGRRNPFHLPLPIAAGQASGQFP